MKIAFSFVLGAIAGVSLFFALYAPSETAQGDSVPSGTIVDEELSPSYQALVLRIADLESQIDALEVERQVAGVSERAADEAYLRRALRRRGPSRADRRSNWLVPIPVSGGCAQAG